MIPVAFPTFYQRFGSDVQTIVGSGITMGSLSAIVLNLAFNVLQRKPKAVEVDDRWTGSRSTRSTRSPTRSSRARSRRCSRASHGIAVAVASQRPFDSIYELRRAFHDALFDCRRRARSAR